MARPADTSAAPVHLTDPFGEVQLQRLPGTCPYPDTIPDIRIFRISRGEAQGSYAQLRLRAASEVTSKFEFETSRDSLSLLRIYGPGAHPLSFAHFR